MVAAGSVVDDGDVELYCHALRACLLVQRLQPLDLLAVLRLEVDAHVLRHVLIAQNEARRRDRDLRQAPTIRDSVAVALNLSAVLVLEGLFWFDVLLARSDIRPCGQ